MTQNRCLYCYEIIIDATGDYHPACSRKFFGTPDPPELPYSEADMLELAKKVIRTHSTLTGVQAKISLDLNPGEKKNTPRRFTIVGLWGHYILKPPTLAYPHLPEVEDVTMHLAALARITTARHSLIRLQSGNLAYITRRFDREKSGKIHVEDFCQLTERMTEHKYRGSCEQIAKAIGTYSGNPGLDIVDFYTRLVFSFLTGNADMHLKNFSLIDSPALGFVLSPAYDLVATALVNPADKEEMALTLNGKKNRIDRADFEKAMTAAALTPKQQENIFEGFRKITPAWKELVGRSFLEDRLKELYQTLIDDRVARVF